MFFVKQDCLTVCVCDVVMDTHTHIRYDFDRIAAYPEAPWDHNRHYHEFLLQHLPLRCEPAAVNFIATIFCLI